MAPDRGAPSQEAHSVEGTLRSRRDGADGRLQGGALSWQQPRARLGRAGLRGLQPARPASDPVPASEKGRGGSCGRATTLQPRPPQLSFRFGRVCPFPGWGLSRRGVEGPGGQWVGDSSNWRLQVCLQSVKGKDNPQDIILHRVTEIQHCKTRHKGKGLMLAHSQRLDAHPRAPVYPEVEFPGTRRVKAVDFEKPEQAFFITEIPNSVTPSLEETHLFRKGAGVDSKSAGSFRAEPENVLNCPILTPLPQRSPSLPSLP